MSNTIYVLQQFYDNSWRIVGYTWLKENAEKWKRADHFRRLVTPTKEVSLIDQDD